MPRLPNSQCLGITLKALDNRMCVTSSYLRHENKVVLILRLLSQVHKSQLFKGVEIEVPQNARRL